MKNIYPNLHIGSQDDYENIVRMLIERDKEDWFVIHACKEPYHRNALGYVGKAAPKDHPEYLIAYRGNHLVLNLVDAPNPAYIPKQIIDEAIKTIHNNIGDRKVFVHCNQGVSRSATIGLLYLKAVHAIDDNFTTAEQEYLELYPWYSPGSGMRGFAMANWNNY